MRRDGRDPGRERRVRRAVDRLADDLPGRGPLPEEHARPPLTRRTDGPRREAPPQLGQTSCSTAATQSAQNVHSKLQIRASSDDGGSGRSQFSQVGRSSSMPESYAVPPVTARTRIRPIRTPRQSTRMTTLPKCAPLCRRS